MTHFVQPIDASLSRSTCIAIEKELDLWLMDANNMNLQEEKMIAGERRILITSLVGKAIDHILKLENNDMRVSCFERIGYLITILPMDNLDTKIRSQGTEKGSFVILKTRAILDGKSNVQVIKSDAEINNVDAILVEERVNIEENNNNNKLLLNSEENND